jgi:hypothetical protein
MDLQLEEPEIETQGESPPEQRETADGGDSLSPDANSFSQVGKRPEESQTDDTPTLSDTDGTDVSDDVITDDEINTILLSGSGTEHGKYRILSCFLQDHSVRERADFLKGEYGTGGRTNALPGNGRSYVDYDSRGLHLKKGDLFEPSAQMTLTWPNVANRIDRLIADNRYMTEA